MEKALTYTIIAGSKACYNNCPICISKMTPDYGINCRLPEVNWKKFDEATIIALNHDAKNVLITGKGEPTIFPAQITKYLIKLYGKPFDKRELQTDGSLLANGGRLYDEFLDVWRELGLNTVAVSIYHYDKEKNREAFRPNDNSFVDLQKLIEKNNSKDLNTRLSCVMLKNYIDSVEEVKKLIQFAKENNAYQLTLRSADRPKNSLDEEVAKYVDNNRLGGKKMQEIHDFLKKEGALCDKLPHGALVYEVDGQNVCMTTGLTYDSGEEKIRQLIFFPQGRLTTSWENVQGGRLL